jgi:hypothetical protein
MHVPFDYSSYPVSSMRSTLLQRLKRRLRSESDNAAPQADSEFATIERLVAEPWYVDRIEISGRKLKAAGWSMPIGLSKPAEGWFTVNGRRFDKLRYPLPRPDVAELIWMRKGAAMSGFEGSVKLSEPYPGGVLEVRRVNSGTPAIERGRDSWFQPDPALHEDLPDEERRYRVIGTRDPKGFLVSGATDYHRIDRAVAAVSGRHIHDFDRVLDWGVGCGRLARHFPRARGIALTGCDIDHDNVAWCSEHLAGRFVGSSMVPPLPFGDASFDLIYSVSVFTHLREPLQLRWLEELGRVMASGALLMTTIHGQTAIDYSGRSPEEWESFGELVRAEGLTFSSSNSQLDGCVDHGGEYVNVYHDLGYLRRVWSRYFDVLHVLHGYIGHHDLVVLRKR